MNPYGISVAWGCDKKWLSAPIVNLPADTIKVRRKLHTNWVAVAFVKTPNAITKYILGTEGDGLKLLYPSGVNHTAITPLVPAISLVSIPGARLLVHGFPTSQLGSSAQLLSEEQAETVLETALFVYHRQSALLDVRLRQDASKPKNEHNRKSPAIHQSPASDLSPHHTHTRDSIPSVREGIVALSNLLGCSHQTATDLVDAGRVVILSTSSIQIPAKSSADSTRAAAKSQP